MEQARISGRQLSLLIIGSITVMGHLLIAPLVFDKAGRDAWLSLIIALVAGFLLALVLAGLNRHAPGQSLVDILVTVLGKPVGNCLTIVYLLYFLLPPALTLRGLMAFMNTVFLRETPALVLGAIFLLVSVYAAWAGLESFVRGNSLLMPLLIAAGITAAVMALPDKDYGFLLPVMERGIYPPLLGSLPLLGLLGEMVAFSMILPSASSCASLGRMILISVGIIGLLFIGPLTGPIAMFSEQLIVKYDYPTYSEFRYGRFLIYFQSLAIFLWLGGNFGRMALYIYVSALGVTRLAGLRNHQKPVMPVAVIILLLAAYAFPTLKKVKEFLATGYPILGIGLGIVLPTFLLLLLVFKKRKNMEDANLMTNSQ